MTTNIPSSIPTPINALVTTESTNAVVSSANQQQLNQQQLTEAQSMEAQLAAQGQASSSASNNQQQPLQTGFDKINKEGMAALATKGQSMQENGQKLSTIGSALMLTPAAPVGAALAAVGTLTSMQGASEQKKAQEQAEQMQLDQMKQKATLQSITSHTRDLGLPSKSVANQGSPVAQATLEATQKKA